MSTPLTAYVTGIGLIAPGLPDWTAGPPKLMKPSFSQNRNASPNDTGQETADMLTPP